MAVILIYMLYTISELRQKLFGPVYDVYEIFKNFYGEEFTDLQGMPSDEDIVCNHVSNHLSTSVILDTSGGENSCEIPDNILAAIKAEYEGTLRPYILVWWPSVTVSNENDRSILIHDLYARVDLTPDGRIPYEMTGFKLNRTTFTDVQFESGYIHSHVPSRCGLPNFQNPCLGRGPIRNTIADLKNNYEEALWMLFCQELSLYVTVESLTGGPYRKLEEVSNLHRSLTYSNFTLGSYGDIKSYIIRWCKDNHINFEEALKDFTKYYISQGIFPVSYTNGKYICSLSYFDYMISISNAFISWFNMKGRRNMLSFIKEYIVEKVVAKEGKFYRLGSGTSRSSSDTYEGQTVLTFKGNDIPLRIIHTDSEQDTHTVTLLDHDIAMCIYTGILKIINYRYKNEHHNTNPGRTSAQTYQTVRYL